MLQDENWWMELNLVLKVFQWVKKKLPNRWSFYFSGKTCSFWTENGVSHHPEMEACNRLQMSNEINFPAVYSTTESSESIFWNSSWYFQIRKGWCKESLLISKDDSPMPFENQYQLIDRPRKRSKQSISLPKPNLLQAGSKAIKIWRKFFYLTARLLQKWKSRVLEKVQGTSIGKYRAASLSSIIIIFHSTGREHKKAGNPRIFSGFEVWKAMNRLNSRWCGNVQDRWVAFICALIAISSGAQTCLWRPPEILE